MYDGTDFNSMTTPGIYYFGTLLNKQHCPPHDTSNAGILFVVQTSASDIKIQIVFSVETQIKISARYGTGTWYTK